MATTFTVILTDNAGNTEACTRATTRAEHQALVNELREGGCQRIEGKVLRYPGGHALVEWYRTADTTVCAPALLDAVVRHNLLHREVPLVAQRLQQR
jgi:hypothetical protein